MDKKITLTQEQIVYLKDFIRKRGFVEPVQIQEILDHFACKVEEVLTQNPSLGLQQAMQQAHHSFGIMGFRPIIREFDDSLKKKYRSIYWSTIKKMLLSFKWLPLIILTAILGYKFMEWTELSGLNNKWDMNIGANTIFVLFISTRIIIFIKTGAFRKRENNYFIKYSNILDMSIPYITLLSFSHSPINHLKAISIFIGLCFTYLLLSSIAGYHTMKTAIKDHENFLKIEEDSLLAVK